MKKKEVVRDYKFSDAKLVTITKEKIAFIRRDKIEFEDYGITTEIVDELEALASAFSDSATDVEFVEAQVEVTTAKDAVGDKLKEAIRKVMSRVVLKYEVQTARYKKFGTEALSQQSDAQLILIAGRVFRVGTEMLAELAANGLTAAMLNNIKSLRDDLEHEIISMNLKIADRDIEQESRVEAGNVIYTTLMKYTATGQSIWATSNVAKYNDYVLYNTPTGEAPDVPTPPVG
jgi:hypothetical protein